MESPGEGTDGKPSPGDSSGPCTSWFRCILPVEYRNELQQLSKLAGPVDITGSLPFHYISLDGREEKSVMDQDLQSYLMQRIQSSAEIQSDVSLSNCRHDNTASSKLIIHLKSLSRGSYLYLKLTLDLIEGGYPVLKSSSFKVS